jgi:NAD+ synthase
VKKFDRIESYLVAFLQNEVQKIGLNRVVLGLSGGIDSAVVALLAKKAFGSNLLCIMMPSSQSSSGSLDDAKELCSVHELPYEIIPIGPLIETYNNTQKITPLRQGNFAARMRMAVLYDVSARENALVLGTSNKSELMLGYGTLHGDLASALNPIGDMYKSDIFEFARHIGVTQTIISKPPSADLWEGQSDEEELGYTYAQIDKFLKAFVDERSTTEELIQMGFDPNLCAMVTKRIYNNQFKRRPPIIAKLSERTIGHDFLYPRDIKN